MLEKKIINQLLSINNWVTGSELARRLNVSSRTITNYIKNINTQYEDLVASSVKGYKIKNSEKALEIINSYDDQSTPINFEGRKHIILSKIILENKRAHIDRLADEFGISSGTLKNEISRIKVELIDFQLNLITKDNVIYIKGDEDNLRKLASVLVRKESNNNLISLKNIKSFFPDFDIDAIKIIVENALIEYNFFVNDLALHNLILHIAIIAHRQKEDKNAKFKDKIKDDILQMTQSIVSQIEALHQITFYEKEVYDIAILVMTRVTEQSTRHLTFLQVTNEIESVTLDIIHEIKLKIDKNFGINFINSSFLTRLALHIDNLILRIENDVQMVNPQANEIKNSFPFMYDVAVLIANIIKERTSLCPNEDEISFLTLHIGVLVEENKRSEEYLNVVVLSPTYVQNFYTNINTLQSTFKNEINILAQISDLAEIESYKKLDLIITTVPIDSSVGKPFVYISERVTLEDITKITKKISFIKNEMIKEKLDAKLKHLFSENLFYADQKQNDKEDILNFLINRLIEENKVDESFREAIFARESISVSSFLRIAMPHPMELIAKESAIAVSLHQEPVEWGANSNINIVLLLAISEHDRLAYKDIVDFITKILMEDAHLDKIIKLKTFEEFSNYLKNSSSFYDN